MISLLYNVFIYIPLYSLLIVFYETFAWHDLGVAIILLTVLIRLLLYPVFHKSIHQQMAMQKIQPKIKELQEKYKHDKEEQTKRLLAFYKENKVNPFSGFLLLLAQLPFLVALFRIFTQGIQGIDHAHLYKFITPPNSLNLTFLGLINLKEQSIVILGLVVIVQFLQGWLAIPAGGGQSAQTSKQMLAMGPVVTLVFFVGLHLPNAIGLYWITTTVFSIGQQLIINRQFRDGSVGTIRKTIN